MQRFVGFLQPRLEFRVYGLCTKVSGLMLWVRNLRALSLVGVKGGRMTVVLLRRPE